MILESLFSLLVASANAQDPGAVPPPPPPLNGQSGSTGLPQAGGMDTGAPSGDPNLGKSADPLTGLLDPFDYQVRGRRDPFIKPNVDKPVAEGNSHGPFLPLQRFNLTDLKLTGIIWDVTRPKAMIVDPDNRVHIVGPNTKIGRNNGYIAVIREGEIVVVETVEEEGRLVSSTKIMRILSK
jgi:type IV pilus assembly protein PilP